MRRYAIYFSPAPDSVWAERGKHWLGRDALTGTNIAQPSIPEVAPDVLYRLTETARRYGFHATLKAPFRLKEKWMEADLLNLAFKFCESAAPLPVQRLGVDASQNFIALRTLCEQPELADFAFRCVRELDDARATLNQEEFEKQARKQLSSRQLELLQRWGYPYVDDEFRFHFTLSDDLSMANKETIESLDAAANCYFAPALASGPLLIDSISIFRAEKPEAGFRIIQRIPLKSHAGSTIAV